MWPRYPLLAIWIVCYILISIRNLFPLSFPCNIFFFFPFVFLVTLVVKFLSPCV